MKISKQTMFWVLFIIMVFGPGIYYIYAPSNWVFEPTKYYAEDVNLSYSDLQRITVDRSIHINFKGDWVDELFLECDSGCTPTTIVQWTGTAIYTKQHSEHVIFIQDLSELNLEPGTYKWYFHINAYLPYGVERQFFFESNPFEVIN